MRISEVKPTDEKLIELMLKDSIGRNADLARFADILSSIEGSASIALDSTWGSGKTFFVKQLKILFDAFNETSNPDVGKYREEIREIWSKFNQTEKPLVRHKVIYYDAWENDNDNDPILSIMYSILKTEVTEMNLTEKNGIGDIVFAVVDGLRGTNLAGIVEKVQGNDLLEEIRKQKNVKEKIGEFLDSLFTEQVGSSEEKQRMIIIVDELDRCNPGYAVKLLERIKHYFDNDRITFLFSTNLSQLEHTIRKHYGQEFDAGRYLNRFFNRIWPLKKVDVDKFCISTGLNKRKYPYDLVCRKVIDYFDLEMRDIKQFFKTAKTVAYNYAYAKGTGTGWGQPGLELGICFILPVMIGLKMINNDKFNLFIEGKYIDPLLGVLTRIDHRRLLELCSQEQTFYELGGQGEKVKVEDKIRELYNSVFVEQYALGENYTTVGDVVFYKETKGDLLTIMSGLSEWSDYSDR